MAGRLDFFFRQKVTEAELDLGFDLLEQADRAMMLDAGLTGVFQGAALSQKGGGANLSVDASGPGIIYDKLGQRIYYGAGQNIPVDVDENNAAISVAAPGNEIRVSVFAKYKRVLSDPRPDGNSVTVYFDRAEGFEFVVRQGAEGAPPATPPALDATYILLGDVKLTFGQTQVLNADIVTDRREDAFVQAGTPQTLRRGLARDAFADITDWYNAHVTGGADLHTATMITYEGGAAWLDGTTNPSVTAEAQLDKVIDDLIDVSASNSGAHKTGSGAVPTTTGGANIPAGALHSVLVALKNADNLDCEARTAWLGGRTNPASSLFGAVDAIITDLAATTAGDDGCERIGAQASGGLSAGSARSQLDQLDTLKAALAGAVFTGDTSVPRLKINGVRNLGALASNITLTATEGLVLCDAPPVNNDNWNIVLPTPTSGNPVVVFVGRGFTGSSRRVWFTNPANLNTLTPADYYCYWDASVQNARGVFVWDSDDARWRLVVDTGLSGTSGGGALAD